MSAADWLYLAVVLFAGSRWFGLLSSYEPTHNGY